MTTAAACEAHIQHVTNLGHRATCYSQTAHSGSRKRWVGPWRPSQADAAGDLAAHDAHHVAVAITNDDGWCSNCGTEIKNGRAYCTECRGQIKHS